MYKRKRGKSWSQGNIYLYIYIHTKNVTVGNLRIGAQNSPLILVVGILATLSQTTRAGTRQKPHKQVEMQ